MRPALAVCHPQGVVWITPRPHRWDLNRPVSRSERSLTAAHSAPTSHVTSDKHALVPAPSSFSSRRRRHMMTERGLVLAADGRLAALVSALDQLPESGFSPSGRRIRQTVRQGAPAKANASSHHAGTARPLSCGEADNRGEEIERPPARIRRFERGVGGASACLDPAQSRGCGEGVGGMRTDSGFRGFSLCSSTARASPSVIVAAQVGEAGRGGRRWGNFPAPGCLFALSVTFSSSSW